MAAEQGSAADALLDDLEARPRFSAGLLEEHLSKFEMVVWVVVGSWFAGEHRALVSEREAEKHMMRAKPTKGYRCKW